jgi:hypothetical protein
MKPGLRAMTKDGIDRAKAQDTRRFSKTRSIRGRYSPIAVGTLRSRTIPDDVIARQMPHRYASRAVRAIRSILRGVPHPAQGGLEGASGQVFGY